MLPTNSASKRGRKPPPVAAVLMAFISVTSQMVALAAVTGGVPSSSRSTPTAMMASALLRGIMPSPTPAVGYKLIERIEVPSGALQCPNSGAGAACTNAAAVPQAGSSAVPTGLAVSMAVTDPSIVAPGKPITFAATASEDVGKIGYRIELRDAGTGQLLTFCSQGTTCSTSLVEPSAGRRTVRAQLAAQSPANHPSSVSVNPTSGSVSGTWLGVALASSTTAGRSGGNVALTATANADLSRTPWSIYIENEAGQMIGQPCNASTCSANAAVGAKDNSRYRALIARSVSDTPNTPNCPGLNGTEISAAHARHMGILPIYNDYDCSAVSGNATGSAYGLAAVQRARNDVIPQGVGIAIDIEPPGDWCPGAANVDKAFIEGWYDQLSHAGYVPTFYGNSSPGSEFARAWCAAVAERPDIAYGSYLWSFEPSLITSHGAQNAPVWGPYNPGCPGHYPVWQYSLNAGSAPDVDVDEATTEFPFWWP